MNTTEPDFMEWVEVDFDGWHLKENAPEKVKIAYNKYMEMLKSDIIEEE